MLKKMFNPHSQALRRQAQLPLIGTVDERVPEDLQRSVINPYLDDKDLTSYRATHKDALRETNDLIPQRKLQRVDYLASRENNDLYTMFYREFKDARVKGLAGFLRLLEREQRLGNITKERARYFFNEGQRDLLNIIWELFYVTTVDGLRVAVLKDELREATRNNEIKNNDVRMYIVRKKREQVYTDMLAILKSSEVGLSYHDLKYDLEANHVHNMNDAVILDELIIRLLKLIAQYTDSYNGPRIWQLKEEFR